jgi:hypothetical protein
MMNMSNMKFIFYRVCPAIIFAISLLSNTLHSQGVTDAVRWSSYNIGGTARTFGVGGAFGAMGGDFSVININPAGIGEYKKSEFVFSPGFSNTRTSAFLKSDPGVLERLTDSWFGIENIAVVISSNVTPYEDVNDRSSRRGGGETDSWLFSNFAFGFSKIADFNRSFSYRGFAPTSITQRWAELATGLQPSSLDDFEAGLAFDAWAIDQIGSTTEYLTDFDEYEGDVFRTQSVNQKGGINELSLAWAGNYARKLNVGLSLGIPFMSFEEQKIYRETDVSGDVPFFKDLLFTESLNISGVGINFKGGFIFNMDQKFRLGGAIHSPTWMRLTDGWQNTMQYNFDDQPASEILSSPRGNFRYRLNTPWRFVASAGSIYSLGEAMGFLNVDVEWVDYGNNRFDFTAFSNDPLEIEFTNQTNRDIGNQLDGALNIRVGSEIAVDVFRFRAGLQLAPSPFRGDDRNNNSISFGAGFRGDSFFMDFGVRIFNNREGYVPYLLADPMLEPNVDLTTKAVRGVMTVGFMF